MNQPDLGKKIAELRKAKGLTQEELVEKCNLNVRTLQRIESGEVTPRSYTIKIIFAALDYNVYDQIEITSYKFSKTGFIIFNWLKQLYRYVIDLFNLKTNTMKKIMILSIAFSAIAFGLFALNTVSIAQKEGKANSQVIDKYSLKNTTSKKIVFSNFTCNGCFDENDEMIGRDVKFKYEGVTVFFRLIKLNKLTREFHSAVIKGKLFPNKVEVTVPERALNSHMINYSAEKVEKSGEKILLIGKAKLTSSQNDKIETDEIIITTNW